MCPAVEVDAGLVHVEPLEDELRDIHRSKKEDVVRARRKIRAEIENFYPGKLDRLHRAHDLFSCGGA